MPTIYETPGVYVEEIATLPASVVQVPTAIPAFIGITEKAPPESDRFHRVASIVEYEAAFGGAVAGGFLYTSMKLFYANGGGGAYVYSVGTSSVGLGKAAFDAALEALKKETEPTLIVFPDAVKLPAELKDVQTAALEHCGKFRNRFCILDVPSSTAMLNLGTFRTDIGANDLQFGAAYGPWLRLSAAGTTATIRKGASAKAVAAKAMAAAAAAEATKLAKAPPEDPKELPKPEALPAALEVAQAAVRTAKIVATKISHAKEDASNVKEIAEAAKTAATNVVTEAESKLADSSGSDFAANSDELATAKGKLVAVSEAAAAASAASEAADAASQAAGKASAAAITAATDAEAATTAEPKDLKSKTQEAANSKATADAVTAQAKKAIAAAEEARLEAAKLLKPTEPTEVPASGAIAGIYAAVDAQRGVWKAPANVSVNGIVGLTETINDEDQESLNVDTDGKSINAIRAFPGKGILVWGARTLDGNDNEWRYVPVRRLFIMAEESIRRSTAFVVFEPNDANTWIKVKAMIENFLNGLWRQGALAGSKPEQAFFVNVGLGTTMTSQDILEGRMIINVGMAAVRPSEFVIIRFSHKLQEA